MKIIRDWVATRKANQWSQNNNTGNYSSHKRKLCHKPLSKPSSPLVYSLFSTTKWLTFFLISVKMDLESKARGIQFEPERSLSNHEGLFKDSSDEGNTMESDVCNERL